MSRKKAILPKSKKPLGFAARNSTNNDARPPRERLESSVLEELWSIWRADPRVPSVNSRRSWAISHNANPRLVDNWFLRRRACAKKTGQPVTDELYDLPLGLPVAPTREQSATRVEHEFEVIPDLPSDDTLVYPSDGDDLDDLEASSDTVFDVEDTPADHKRAKTLAYKEVSQQPCLEHHRFQSESSSVDVCAAKNHFYMTTSLASDQGRGKQSNFTGILCPTMSAQGALDEALPDSSAMSGSGGFPCLRLDFLSDTLSELSAIPFLFRTPLTVLPDNAARHRNVDNWAIVEDELGRLVNEGKLDFSFLDVPDLASMELPD